MGFKATVVKLRKVEYDTHVTACSVTLACNYLLIWQGLSDRSKAREFRRRPPRRLFDGYLTIG